jgi:hypothetical protein
MGQIHARIVDVVRAIAPAASKIGAGDEVQNLEITKSTA